MQQKQPIENTYNKHNPKHNKNFFSRYSGGFFCGGYQLTTGNSRLNKAHVVKTNWHEMRNLLPLYQKFLTMFLSYRVFYITYKILHQLLLLLMAVLKKSGGFFIQDR